MEEITGEDKTELPIRDPIFAFSNPISQGFEDQTELFLFPFKGLRFARNPKSGNLQIFCIIPPFLTSQVQAHPIRKLGVGSNN